MATAVSVREIDSGNITFYSTYDDARSAANAGDVISIFANLNESIYLKTGVDIYIDPGTVIEVTTSEPTIFDGEGAICNITGGGIIKNSSNAGISIINNGSIVNIECQMIESEGSASVVFDGADRCSLICDSVFNQNGTAINVSNCLDLFMRIGKVESGTPEDPNGGDPVISLASSPGSIYINEIICNGYGSCINHISGTIAANITNIYTLLPANETPDTASPTILLAGEGDDPDLTLYFDEIKNLNSNEGDAVKITKGKANLIGRKIMCIQGKSLDLTDSIVSAFIQCDEIVSLTQGINIENSDEPIIIDTSYIEGNIGNDGVVKSVSGSNYILRNAKIKCTDETEDSICIYIDEGEQNIEFENLILVTGNLIDGETILRVGNNIEIRNLNLFVNKSINENLITLLIGTGMIVPEDYNYKYIVSDEIS